MLPPLPRCSRRAQTLLKLARPCCQPSPHWWTGRPAHRLFRGLLSVYSRCGLHTRTVTYVTVIRGLQTLRYLHACPGCFRLELLAGWDFHPLESAAFARRTPKSVIVAAHPIGAPSRRRSQSVARSPFAASCKSSRSCIRSARRFRQLVANRRPGLRVAPTVTQTKHFVKRSNGFPRKHLACLALGETHQRRAKFREHQGPQRRSPRWRHILQGGMKDRHGLEQHRFLAGSLAASHE